MTKEEITRLKDVIESGFSEKYRIAETWPHKRTIQNFHQWADDKACKGAYLISDCYDVSYWFLLSEWKDDRFYLIVLDRLRKGPIVEIHKLTGDKNDNRLQWTYKPTKKDGRNAVRKKYFEQYYFSITASLSFPTKNGYQDFLADMFSLIEIRQKADLLDVVKPEDRDSFPEGKRVQRIHLARERNRALVERAKYQFKKSNSRLFCEMCCFDFRKKYGELGSDFIEAHHTLPLSCSEEDIRVTKVEDLMMLCSNCHRMVHRHRPWLTPFQIRSFFNHH